MFSFLRKKRSENLTQAICPNCNKEIAIKRWDEQTKSFLGDNIPSLINGRNTKIPYQCPECFTGYLAKYIRLI